MVFIDVNLNETSVDIINNRFLKVKNYIFDKYNKLDTQIILSLGSMLNPLEIFWHHKRFYVLLISSKDHGILRIMKVEDEEFSGIYFIDIIYYNNNTIKYDSTHILGEKQLFSIIDTRLNNSDINTIYKRHPFYFWYYKSTNEFIKKIEENTPGIRELNREVKHLPGVTCLAPYGIEFMKQDRICKINIPWDYKYRLLNYFQFDFFADGKDLKLRIHLNDFEIGAKIINNWLLKWELPSSFKEFIPSIEISKKAQIYEGFLTKENSWKKNWIDIENKLIQELENLRNRINPRYKDSFSGILILKDWIKFIKVLKEKKYQKQCNIFRECHFLGDFFQGPTIYLHKSKYDEPETTDKKIKMEFREDEGFIVEIYGSNRNCKKILQKDITLSDKLIEFLDDLIDN